MKTEIHIKAVLRSTNISFDLEQTFSNKQKANKFLKSCRNLSNSDLSDNLGGYAPKRLTVTIKTIYKPSKTQTNGKKSI